MREKRLYTCDICNTDYADKQKAMECEKNHKLLEKATIVGEYKSIRHFKWRTLQDQSKISSHK